MSAISAAQAEVNLSTGPPGSLLSRTTMWPPQCGHINARAAGSLRLVFRQVAVALMCSALDHYCRGISFVTATRGLRRSGRRSRVAWPLVRRHFAIVTRHWLPSDQPIGVPLATSRWLSTSSAPWDRYAASGRRLRPAWPLRPRIGVLPEPAICTGDAARYSSGDDIG